MDAVTYTAARTNLASTMDRACNDHEALNHYPQHRGSHITGHVVLVQGP